MSTLPNDTTAPQDPLAGEQYHDYSTNRIPWYVRLIWLGFWIFAIYYVAQYLFPALRIEFLDAP